MTRNQCLSTTGLQQLLLGGLKGKCQVQGVWLSGYERGVAGKAAHTGLSFIG